MEKLASPDGAALADRVRAAQLPTPANRRRIRLRAGLSLRLIGDHIGVTAMTVLRWERGEAAPKFEHAVAYRQLLEELEAACAS
jgi:DNA-binding XRE family transcriptional regulator